MFSKKALSVAILSVIMAGCGGGGSSSDDNSVVDNQDNVNQDNNNEGEGGGGDNTLSTDIAGLTLPDQMDIVAAADEQTGVETAFVGLTPKRLALSATNAFTRSSNAFDDANTDFSTDEARAHIWLEALEPISMVNSILCFTAQFKADEMVNQGAYVALIDDSECDENGNDNSSSSGGQSSAADNNPEFVEVVINSVRESNDDPMVVSLWMPDMEAGGPEGEMSQAIKAKIVVDSAPTDSNPFGEFTLNFQTFSSIDSDTAFGEGELKTVDAGEGFFGFTLYDRQTPMAGFVHAKDASVVMSSDKTQGFALTSVSNQFDGQVSADAYGLAFNDTHVNIESAASYSELSVTEGVVGEPTCLSRNDFREMVWRYNLYDAVTGERVDHSSGFPFRYDSTGDGELDAFGHASYWGIWTENDTTLETGDSIVKENHNGTSAEQISYTVTAAPGRLTKHSVKSLSVSDLGGVDFNYWDDTLSEGVDSWLVNWVDTGVTETTGFYKVGSVSWGDSGRFVNEFEADNYEMLVLADGDNLHMFSDQLGGGVQWVKDATIITYFTEEFVNGSETAQGELFADSSATLLCVHDCPKANISAEDLSSFTGPYSDADFSGPGPLEPVEYTIDNSGNNALTLLRNGQPVKYVATREQLPSDSPFSWGVRSGPLVTAAVAANITSAEDLFNPNKVSSFYTWQTGLEHWDQQIVLTDESGDTVAFAKPIQFSYTHSTEKDRNDSSEGDGVVVLMDYFGAGELHGIPWLGDTPEDLDPEDEEDSQVRFFPMFNIADGVVVGDENEYVVKAVDMEQKMSPVDSTNCDNLPLVAPSTAVPTEVTGTVDIGAMPEVDDTPAVVAGDLQITLD